METPAAPIPDTARDRASRTSIASVVLGSSSILLAIAVVGVVPGLIGIGLGLWSRRREGATRTWAQWGIGLSVSGLVLSLTAGATAFWMYREIQQLGKTTESPSKNRLTAWQGVLAPDLKVTTTDGRVISLQELRGRRVILDFWATWCPPCVKEIPHFSQLYRETTRDQLEIVGISNEDRETILGYAKKNQVPYPMGSAEALPAPYDAITSIPTTFFLDRRGVIQSVLIGYHDLESLRQHALDADTEGEPLLKPAERTSGLKESAHPLHGAVVWTTKVPKARSLAAGDLDGSGTPQVLVTAGDTLNRFAFDGTALGSIAWDHPSEFVEVGRRAAGPQLLAYDNWGDAVHVIDPKGHLRWKTGTRQGVDGAHWGDLDGDGVDEMVVGYNGTGGLAAFSTDGKQLWKDSSIGNVWTQAIVPATKDHPARVFATEASGSVHVYDAAGSRITQFRFNGEYCSPMAAARVDRAGRVQVIGEVGDDTAVAVDERGRVAWQTPVNGQSGNWRRPLFGVGDFDGDGVAEWVFREGSNLVMVSPDGEQRAKVELRGEADAFLVVPRSAGSARLLVLQGDQLTAYDFAP